VKTHSIKAWLNGKASLQTNYRRTKAFIANRLKVSTFLVSLVQAQRLTSGQTLFKLVYD
jgi:hypothetical protein